MLRALIPENHCRNILGTSGNIKYYHIIILFTLFFIIHILFHTNFSENALRAIATYLNLVPPEGKENEAPWHRMDKEFLKELLVRHYYKGF